MYFSVLAARQHSLSPCLGLLLGRNRRSPALGDRVFGTMLSTWPLVLLLKIYTIFCPFWNARHVLFLSCMPLLSYCVGAFRSFSGHLSFGSPSSTSCSAPDLMQICRCITFSSMLYTLSHLCTHFWCVTVSRWIFWKVINKSPLCLLEFRVDWATRLSCQTDGNTNLNGWTLLQSIVCSIIVANCGSPIIRSGVKSTHGDMGRQLEKFHGEWVRQWEEEASPFMFMEIDVFFSFLFLGTKYFTVDTKIHSLFPLLDCGQLGGRDAIWPIFVFSTPSLVSGI